MIEESPALPGFEGFVPRLRVPVPSNYPGKLIQLSTERDIFIGITSPSEALVEPERLSTLTPEQQGWEDAQGLMTAQRVMKKFDGVFWGCPEGDFSLLVSEERHPDFESYPRKFSARFNSNGRVCITRSSNLAFGRTHPETLSFSMKGALAPSSVDDTFFDVPQGNYVVTVTQMFSWRDSQFVKLPEGHIHYHLHFGSLSDCRGPLNTDIPWLPIPLPI